jgi:large subunit ribosomal protein L15
MLNSGAPRTRIAKPKKRIGRGYGSGKGGHTVGRGTKGQKARNNVPVGFEGGQVPLYKRLPQIGGFRNPNQKDIVAIPVDRLNSFKEDSEVTPEKLVEAGVIRRVSEDGVKLLGGKLEKKLKLKGFLMSKGAEKAIKASGSLVI